MIAFAQGSFRSKFDVIVNEVRKYSAKAGKFEAKVDKQCERLNVIVFLQIMIARSQIKHAAVRAC